MFLGSGSAPPDQPRSLPELERLPCTLQHRPTAMSGEVDILARTRLDR